MKTRLDLGAPLVIGIALCMPLVAQQPRTEALLTFEVASVKRNVSSSADTTQSFVPFTFINVSLRTLVLTAYDVPAFLLSGGPAWTGTDMFDVIAKTTEGTKPSRDDIRQMLRTLPMERFKLRVRRETTIRPVYQPRDRKSR